MKFKFGDKIYHFNTQTIGLVCDIDINTSTYEVLWVDGARMGGYKEYELNEFPTTPLSHPEPEH